MDKKKVLIIDDDAMMRQVVSAVVAEESEKIYTAIDGVEGLNKFHEIEPDLVILDLMMPKMTGWELCRQIRKSSNTPIIMLTAMSEDMDVVRGLDEGADDYVVKPFSADILLARVRAALRRSQPKTILAQPIIYSDDYLTIDLRQRRMLVDGQLVKLTATEYRLLSYLLHNPSQILTFRQILENVWGGEFKDNTDYVHVYVWHLRRKLEQNPKSPRYILTEHGVGYRFEKAEQTDPEPLVQEVSTAV